ncbi:MAG: HEAT repeat domain-containing protein [Planctomycetes bacterium]|nr:HEAT repeat domain-containing protein [Planctomycetota bacterium]
MAKELQQIVAMLSSPNVELQCAAAKVLGELGDRAPAVLKGLETLLSSSSGTAKQYALGAIVQLGARDSAPALLPLLKEAEPLRKVAGDALVELGLDALPALESALAGADVPLKLALLPVLGRMRSKDSLAALFDLFLDPDVEVIKRATDTVRERAEAMTEKERAELLARALKFLGQAKVQKSERAHVSAVKVVGATRLLEAASPLLELLDGDRPTGVRMNALLALARLPVDAEASARQFAAVLPLLRDADFANVVTNALAALQRLPVDKKTQKDLVALLDSPHGQVRAFAVRALGALGNDKSAAALLPLVHAPDRRLADEAASALRAQVAFAPAVAAALAVAEDAARAWSLGSVLRAHKDAVGKTEVAGFVKQAVRFLEQGDERWKALVEMLKDVAPEPLRVAVRERGAKLRKAGDLAKAESFLRLLDRDELADAESRYELGVVLLLQSSGEPARPGSDPRSPIPHLSVLLRSGSIPVAKRLRAEKPPLGAAEYAYLGFHFSERQGPERDFGGEMLRVVTQKFPRSQEAKVAKQKLRTEGLEGEARGGGGKE